MSPEYHLEQDCGFTVQISKHLIFKDVRVFIVLNRFLKDSEKYKLEVLTPNKLVNAQFVFKAYFLQSENITKANFFKIFLVVPNDVSKSLASDSNTTVHFIPCKHFYKMSHANDEKILQKGIPGFKPSTNFPLRCNFENPNNCSWVALQSSGNNFERVQYADCLKNGMYVDKKHHKWFAAAVTPSDLTSSLFVSPLIERRSGFVEVSFYYVVEPGNSLSAFIVDEHFEVKELQEKVAYDVINRTINESFTIDWVFARVQLKVPPQFHSFHVSFG